MATIAPGDRIYVPSRTFCEELTHGKKTCPPCGRPQTACPLGACGGGEHGPDMPHQQTFPPGALSPSRIETLPAPAVMEDKAGR